MLKGAPQFLGRAEGAATVADGRRQSAACGRADSRRSRADLLLERECSPPRFCLHVRMHRGRERMHRERHTQMHREMRIAQNTSLINPRKGGACVVGCATIC